MLELMRNFWTDESGQDLAEYGLLVVLIAVAVIAGVMAFGGDLLEFFEGLADRLGLPGDAAPGDAT
jgi:pilus assembly protein Flp/PilA